MNIRDRRTLHESAAASVANAGDALKGIVLIYLAIITALTLVGSVLTVLLSDRIAETGGLSGMGLRSILSTLLTAPGGEWHGLAPLLPQYCTLCGFPLYKHSPL